MNRFKVGDIVVLEEDFGELEKIRQKLKKEGIRFSPNNINYIRLKKSGIKEFIVEGIDRNASYGRIDLIRVVDANGIIDSVGLFEYNNEYRFKKVDKEVFELEKELFII